MLAAEKDLFLNVYACCQALVCLSASNRCIWECVGAHKPVQPDRSTRNMSEIVDGEETVTLDIASFQTSLAAKTCWYFSTWVL